MSPDPAARFVIYTDGGASPNPGPGGWGAVILDASGQAEEIAGGEADTTNNRMELLAAISALAHLPRPSAVTLCTDSRYLRQGITSWVAGWRARGWKRRDGKPVRNVDLWRRLADMNRRHRVDWRWVKGHAGNEWNERADELATAEIEAQSGGAEAPPAGEEDLPADVTRVFLRVRSVGARGAWVAVLETPDGEEVARAGRSSNTTPNRLELEALLEALAVAPVREPVAVFTANGYVSQGASVWRHAWKRDGWRTRSGGAVKNAELWRRLDAELEKREVLWPAAAGEAAMRLEELKQRVRQIFAA